MEEGLRDACLWLAPREESSYNRNVPVPKGRSRSELLQSSEMGFGSGFSPVVICSHSAWGLLVRSGLPFTEWFIRERFTRWRKRTEPARRRGNIIFLCIFVRWQPSHRVPLKVYEIFGNWARVSPGQRSNTRYPSSVFRGCRMVGMRVERNKLLEATRERLAALPWASFSTCFSLPLVPVPIRWNFTAAKFQCSNKKDILKNDKAQASARPFTLPEFIGFVLK